MVRTSPKANEGHVCFTFIDERIIVPPLLPPLLVLLKIENVVPLTRIAESKTEIKNAV